MGRVLVLFSSRGHPSGSTLIGLALAVAIAGSARAQPPESAQSELAGLKAPPVKVVPPATPEQLQSFVEGISRDDAVIEVPISQGRLITLKEDLAVPNRPSPLVATGDPSVVDFEIVGNRHIRVTGRRVGVTDLSVVRGDSKSYSFQIHVVADLDILRARLRQAFPDATLKLSQIRDHVIVEGEARDSRQVERIIATIKAFMVSVHTAQLAKIQAEEPRDQGAPVPVGVPTAPAAPAAVPPPGGALPAPAGSPAEPTVPGLGRPEVRATVPEPQVINLIRVPGSQQVMLKVQVAELNRTALRRLGIDFLFQDQNGGFGQNVGGGIPIGASGVGGLLTAGTPIFGVVDGGHFATYINALRRNQVFNVMAEPNLVAMNGQQASFLAGGEFPVPVPQSGAGTGGFPVITVQYKEFGVELNFVPFIVDGDTVRMVVSPSVSSIDFALGITQQGFQIPALNKRRTSTTVELRQGQTLAISGLLQVEFNGETNRIPGLGDLPYIGALFSNNSSQKTEKELVILVTPYLVEPIAPWQKCMLPGEDLCEPDDCEMFLRGRIEGRDQCSYRSTLAWDDPLRVEHEFQREQKFVFGPVGYSE